MPGGDGSGSFYIRPQEEVCQVGSEICTRIPGTRIYCKTEGRSLLACPECLKAWRAQVTRSPSEQSRLSLRCPKCADWAPEKKQKKQKPRPPASQSALKGDVADAINRAMHAEGLLQDVRERVLQRLARDAPWLEDAGTPR